MTPATALRALADHLDQHPHLATSYSISTRITSWAFEVQTFGGRQSIANLLAWHDSLDSASVTAKTSANGAVHVHIHGLLEGLRVLVADVVTDAEADLLRLNLALSYTRHTAVPVSRLRALVSAPVAEQVERPIVDQHLVGGAR